MLEATQNSAFQVHAGSSGRLAADECTTTATSGTVTAQYKETTICGTLQYI
jgi:hypothetical protein